MYKPLTSIFNAHAKLDKDSPSPSVENSCNQATNDGKNAIP